MREGFLDLCLLHFLVGIFADHLDIAPEGECAYCIFRFSLFHNPKLGPETDGEGQNSDAG